MHTGLVVELLLPSKVGSSADPAILPAAGQMENRLTSRRNISLKVSTKDRPRPDAEPCTCFAISLHRCSQTFAVCYHAQNIVSQGRRTSFQHILVTILKNEMMARHGVSGYQRMHNSPKSPYHKLYVEGHDFLLNLPRSKVQTCFL